MENCQSNGPLFHTARWVAVGALLMAAGVALGAFGAHGLKHRLSEADLTIFQTGVFYQLVHALAIMAIALAGAVLGQPARFSRICLLMLASIAVFSGSLYLLVLTNTRWLGAITPLGGTGFIAGWIWLAASSCKCACNSKENGRT